MSLDPGSKLGSYEILSPLGAGGMGEVYRARDTKLGRDVAIKVLPAEVTNDAERLGRFKREAQVLASLNHPHIAAIHGLEEDGARPFLVLELVEGETLAERLSRGPLPVEEAVELSQQVAEALEQAHGKGIVHRDLKPANIKITPEGQIKVLDFGLAKAFAGEGAEGELAELSQSPTLSRHTAAGVILGTAAYMSPEQARGKTVDKRADIWAFGVVLYEMLTGGHLFAGETVSDVLADVLRGDIDWTQLPAGTPPRLHRLLRRTLARDPNERLHDIADARLELRDVGGEDVVPIPPASVRSPRGMIAALLLAAAAIASIATWMAKPDGAVGSASVRFAVPIPGAIRNQFLSSGTSLALSPDGALLVFASQEGLYLRRMDELDFRRIEGTDGGYGPFFSSDSEWLGFFADGKLKKVSLANEAVLTLCDARQGRGGAWREDGSIFFAPDSRSGLFRVSAAGGEPSEVSRLDPERRETSHRWPSLLPGGERAFVTIEHDNDAEPVVVALVSLDTGELEYLVQPALDGRYLPSGHILYSREGVMLAAPFDLDRMEIVGAEAPVLADLALPPNVSYLQVSYGVSRDGVFAYMLSPSLERELVLVDLDGNKKPASTQTTPARGLNFAPDGRSAAVGVLAGESDEVWLLDFERELLTRMSSIEGTLPVWSPDGRRIAVHQSGTTEDIVVFSVEEDTPPETWVSHSQNLIPRDWTADGRAILYAKREDENWHIALKSGDGDEQILLDDPFAHRFPRLSPDGSWLAYQSNENGRDEIFVRAFPAMDKKQQISASGGTEPHWSPDGSTLYYLNDDFLMSAPVTSTMDRVVAGPARSLFRVGMGRRGAFQGYDIAPDGKTFLFLSETDESAPEIRVVLNGLEELVGEK